MDLRPGWRFSGRALALDQSYDGNSRERVRRRCSKVSAGEKTHFWVCFSGGNLRVISTEASSVSRLKESGCESLVGSAESMVNNNSFWPS